MSSYNFHKGTDIDEESEDDIRFIIFGGITYKKSFQKYCTKSLGSLILGAVRKKNVDAIMNHLIFVNSHNILKDIQNHFKT